MDTLLRIMIFFAIGLNMASCNPRAATDRNCEKQADNATSTTHHTNQHSTYANSSSS